MPDLYSPSWIDSFNEAVAGIVIEFDEGSTSSLQRRAVRMRQEVTGGPQGTFFVTMTVLDGRLRMALDDSGTPGDVTVHLTFDDANTLNRGEMSPTELLASGRLRVRGDLSVLGAIQASLASASGALSGLSA